MKAIDKANELVEKYNILLSVHVFNGTYDIAKQCAILAVDEIINEFYTHPIAKIYWQEVKREIEKL
jgi:hypothetical protein